MPTDEDKQRDAAATKIQALTRGKNARKNVPPPGAAAAKGAAKQLNRNHPETKAPARTPAKAAANEKQQKDQAASKIQARLRGNKERKKVQEIKGNRKSPDSGSKKDQSSRNTSPRSAASRSPSPPQPDVTGADENTKPGKIDGAMSKKTFLAAAKIQASVRGHQTRKNARKLPGKHTAAGLLIAAINYRLRLKNMSADEFFKMCDQNNSGWVTKNHIRRGILKLGLHPDKDEFATFLAYANEDHDHKLTCEELRQALVDEKVLQAAEQAGRATAERLKNFASEKNLSPVDLFTRLDSDKRGKVTRDMLEDGLEELAYPIKDDELDALMSLADVNADGLMRRKEFDRVLSLGKNEDSKPPRGRGGARRHSRDVAAKSQKGSSSPKGNPRDRDSATKKRIEHPAKDKHKGTSARSKRSSRSSDTSSSSLDKKRNDVSKTASSHQERSSSVGSQGSLFSSGSSAGKVESSGSPPQSPKSPGKSPTKLNIRDKFGEVVTKKRLLDRLGGGEERSGNSSTDYHPEVDENSDSDAEERARSGSPRLQASTICFSDARFGTIDLSPGGLAILPQIPSLEMFTQRAQNIIKRYPDIDPRVIVELLEQLNGHAGKAIDLLKGWSPEEAEENTKSIKRDQKDKGKRRRRPPGFVATLTKKPFELGENYTGRHKFQRKQDSKSETLRSIPSEKVEETPPPADRLERDTTPAETVPVIGHVLSQAVLSLDDAEFKGLFKTLKNDPDKLDQRKLYHHVDAHAKKTAGKPVVTVDRTERTSDPLLEQIAFVLKDKKMRIRDVISNMDADGSGELDREEMRTGLQGVGIEATKEEVDSLFSFVDSDGAGTVSVKELNRALRHCIPVWTPEQVQQFYSTMRERRRKQDEMARRAEFPPPQELQATYRKALEAVYVNEKDMREYAGFVDKTKNVRWESAKQRQQDLRDKQAIMDSELTMKLLRFHGQGLHDQFGSAWA